MITPVCQRWRAQRATYRPASEPFDPRAYSVAAIPDDTTARAFVEEHHYSGTYPAARVRVGMYERGGALVGVVVFSQPMHASVLKDLPGKPEERAELGRIVLLDGVKANAETWLVARAGEIARERGILSVVSMSDPMRRASVDGRLAFAGHIGTIYQASNAVYRGLTPRRSERLLRDGRVFCARSISKIRSKDRGWRYSVDELVKAGATPPRTGEDLRAWLTRELGRVTRCVRHPGKHRYLLAFEKGARRHINRLSDSKPYPKLALSLFDGVAA